MKFPNKIICKTVWWVVEEIMLKTFIIYQLCNAQLLTILTIFLYSMAWHGLVLHYIIIVLYRFTSSWNEKHKCVAVPRHFSLLRIGEKRRQKEQSNVHFGKQTSEGFIYYSSVWKTWTFFKIFTSVWNVLLPIFIYGKWLSARRAEYFYLKRVQ